MVSRIDQAFRLFAACSFVAAIAACGGGSSVESASTAAASAPPSSSNTSREIAKRLGGPGCMGLVVTPTNVGATLADNLFGANSGIAVTDVAYDGAPLASGVFDCGQNIIGFGEGIVLTTGHAQFVIGPNDNPDFALDNGWPGTPLIPDRPTVNATTLTISFIPRGNTIQLQYVFGSEEYNEYVYSEYNDAFRFFVNGTNYALLPDLRTQVEINSVNNGFAPTGQVAAGPCVNCAFFRDNNGDVPPINTQLDGLTKPLTLTAPVIPGAVNTLVIVIADATDFQADSAVFIKGRSFRVARPGGAGGDVHVYSYEGVNFHERNFDWHGAGCYRIAHTDNDDGNNAGNNTGNSSAASSYRSLGDNIRVEAEAEPYDLFPGTSVYKRAAFTFPKTGSHVVVFSKTEHYFELIPIGGGVTPVTDGNTIRFYEEGTERLLGTITTPAAGRPMEYTATYENGTEVRAFVLPGLSVDVSVSPVWNERLIGLSGVFPVRGDGTVLSKSRQAYALGELKTNLAELNGYARSWECEREQSLFDLIASPPAEASDQLALVTVDPAAIPAAAAICTAAGVPPQLEDRFESCVFDVVMSGPVVGSMMAAHAGIVAASTVPGLSPPTQQPDPPQCPVSATRARWNAGFGNGFQSVEFATADLRLIPACLLVDSVLKISAHKIELNKALATQSLNVNTRLR